MIVGVPRETFPGERRVALVPAAVPALAKAGLEVVVEAGAGAAAGYPDADYVARGARTSRPPRGRVRRGRHRGPGPLPRLQRPDGRPRTCPCFGAARC